MRLIPLLFLKTRLQPLPEKTLHPVKRKISRSFLIPGAFFLAFGLFLNPLAFFTVTSGAAGSIPVALADCGTPTPALTPGPTPTVQDMSHMSGHDMGSMGTMSPMTGMPDMSPMADMTAMPGMTMDGMDDMPGMTMDGMDDMPGMDNMTPSTGQHSHHNMNPTPCPGSTAPQATPSPGSTQGSHDMANMPGMNGMGTMPGHYHGVTVIPPDDGTKAIVLSGFAGANGIVIVMAALARRRNLRRARLKAARKARSKIINRIEKGTGEE